jgi:hypothetical protein
MASSRDASRPKGKPKLLVEQLEAAVLIFGVADTAAALREAHTQRCPVCGLKPWDAADLTPGEFVCTCNDPINEEN